MSIRTDSDIYLPPAETVKDFDTLREYLQKVNNILNSNQQDNYEDFSNSVDNQSNQYIKGTKIFESLKLGGNMDCNQKQMISMVIENRISDPTDPVEGQIWLRTDLL